MLLARSDSDSSYEAIVVSPQQVMIILNELDNTETRLEWMLALLHAATALRPEEAFGLRWLDLDWQKGQIDIRRGWSKGEETHSDNNNSINNLHGILGTAKHLIIRASTALIRDSWVGSWVGTVDLTTTKCASLTSNRKLKQPCVASVSDKPCSPQVIPGFRVGV